MSDHIVGIDEVGRGSLVGSAVVCAFRSDDTFFQSLPFEVIDSKKISQKKFREKDRHGNTERNNH